MNGIRKIQLVLALAVAAMVPSGAREQIYRASTHEEWFRGLDGLSISREVCDGIPAMEMMVCRSKAGQGRFLLRAEERDSPELYLLPEEAEKAVVRIRVYLPEGGGISGVTLTGRDAKGEVFAYRQEIPRDRTGWMTLEYRLDRRNPPRNSAGGNADGKIDGILRIADVRIELSSSQETGSIGVGEVRMTPLEVELRNRVWRPGMRNSFRISGLPSSVREISMRADFRGENDAEFAAPVTRKLPVRDGASEWMDLPVPAKFGPYTVRAALDNGDAPLPGDFAYLPERLPASSSAEDFQLGVQAQIGGYNPEIVDEMLSLAEECGIMLLRSSMHVRWRELEKTPGRWDFRISDELFARVKEGGFRLMVTLNCPPKHGRAARYRPIDPERAKRRPDSILPDADLFAAYAARVAQRYGEQVMFWEIGNEPDLISFANYPLDEYINLLRKSRRKLKQASPDAMVMNGGIATIDGHASQVEPEYLRKFLEKAPADSYDVFAFHFHSEPAAYRRSMEKLLELRRSIPVNKPFFPNETAYPCGPGFVSRYEQAEILWKKLLYSWAKGMRGYVWYNLRCNVHHADDNAEANYGLLSKDLSPRPAYVAYHTLTNYFTGAKFIRTLNDGGGAEFYLFRGVDGSWLIPFWSLEPEYRKPWLLTGVGRRAELIDLWGNIIRNPGEDVVSVTVGARPMLLRIPPQREEPRLVGEPVSVREGIFVPHNGSQSNVLLLRNRFGGTWKGALTLEVPEHLEITPKTISFDLAPSAEREVPFTVKFKKKLTGTPNRSCELTVHLQSDRLKEAEISFPVRSAVLIQERYSESPLFVLNQSSQVQRLFPSEGDNEKYFWKSPEDLSAEIDLKTDRKDLCLRIVVRDDVHKSPYRAGELWKGDSIQLAFSIPRQKGEWKFGFSLADDGAIQKYCWDVPAGFSAGNVIRSMKVSVTREETKRTTVYEVKIPFRVIGLSNAAGRKGFGFSMVVNDCDIDVRESILYLSDGISNGILKPDLWPVLCF